LTLIEDGMQEMINEIHGTSTETPAKRNAIMKTPSSLVMTLSETGSHLSVELVFI
jgi:hypothetical protein